MARSNVLRWLDGRGWLVLSGGGDELSEVRAQALWRTSADGGVAYVSLGGQNPLGERALTDMEDLGAPPGYLIDVLSEDDQTIHSKLADAGMVVIEQGANLEALHAGLLGAAVDGIQAAFQNGAVILVEGDGVMLFGAWVLTAGGLVAGLEWVEGALIVPGITSVSESDDAQAALKTQPSALAIGIGSDSALALGPDGEIETWGQRQVTIVLGRDYHAS